MFKKKKSWLIKGQEIGEKYKQHIHIIRSIKISQFRQISIHVFQLAEIHLTFINQNWKDFCHTVLSTFEPE